MSAKQILEMIGQQYELIVRASYHVQICVGKGQYHDLWPMQNGSLKVKLYGMNRCKIYHNAQSLLSRLATYNYEENSDLAKLREMERLIRKTNGRPGIFCDAGYKDGASKLAVIRVFDGGLDVHVRYSINYDSSIEAEIGAIKFAAEHYTFAETIYSDCKAAVDEFNLIHGVTTAVWINRGRNYGADQLSNLRG